MRNLRPITILLSENTAFLPVAWWPPVTLGPMATSEMGLSRTAPRGLWRCAVTRAIWINIATGAASYGLGSGTSFRPEIFAYHAWDDINDYINRNRNCDSVENHHCTTWILLRSLSNDSWDKSMIWDTEVGAGQVPQANPDAVTQACAASFLLRLTATSSSRISRIYYTRPHENDGEHWSLFTPSGMPKPAFTVLADRDTSYTPSIHRKCP